MKPGLSVFLLDTYPAYRLSISSIFLQLEPLRIVPVARGLCQGHVVGDVRGGALEATQLGHAEAGAARVAAGADGALVAEAWMG